MVKEALARAVRANRDGGNYKALFEAARRDARVGKALFGLGLPWIIVAMLTLLQRSTPANLQGRAFAASELALGAPQTLSIALGAALVALVDYRFVLVVQAATVGLAGVYLLGLAVFRLLRDLA